MIRQNISIGKNVLVLIVSLFLGSYLSFNYAQGSDSSGTIDAANKLTKICKNETCSSFGNINWKPTLNANTPGATAVTITDTAITGYLWGDEIGWVNLAPTGSGLSVNPTTGVISGMAYSTVTGWINFSVTGQSVVLVDNGAGSNFYGYAYVSGANGGWMKFDCSSASTCIKTDWRATSYRATSTPTPVTGGGGGASSPSSPPSTPPSTPPTTPPIPPQQPLPPPPATPPSVPATIPQTPSVNNLNSSPPNSNSGASGSSGNVGNGQFSNYSSGDISNPNYIPPFVDQPLQAAQMTPDRVYILFASDKINFPLKKGGFLVGGKNNEQRFEGEYYRVPVGKTLSFAVKPSREPKNITIVSTYKGPLIETRTTIIPKQWTVWDRIKEILFLGKFDEISLIDSAYAQTITGNVTVYDNVKFIKGADGVYRADYQVEQKPGLYELKTVVEYSNGETEEVQSTSVVFDQGESFGTYKNFFSAAQENVQSKLTFYKLNPKSNQFELWDASFYNEKNPLTTDKNGNYSVVAPPGIYKIKAEAKGYYNFITGEFTVSEDDRIINHRISMVGKFWTNLKILWPIKFAIFIILIWIIYKLNKFRKKPEVNLD